MMLRFLHIPKTAGGTFTRILMHVYHGRGHFFFHGTLDADLARFLALPRGERTRIGLFLGHAPLVTGIAAADQAPTITLLRDPIQRVKSFCQHVAEGKSEYLRHAFPPGQFDLDRFLASGNGELANLHTKFLLNQGCCGSQFRFQQIPAGDARDLALEHLFHRIAHFGLLEYFDESLALFSSALQWRPPAYQPENRKRRHNRLVFLRRHEEQIAALNAIDLEVYQAAKEKFLRERTIWAQRGRIEIRPALCWMERKAGPPRCW